MMKKSLVLQIVFLIIISVGLLAGFYLVKHFNLTFPKATIYNFNVLQTETSKIKSVTYYPGGLGEFNTQDLINDIPKLKQNGINTVFIVNPWNQYNNQPLTTPAVYNDATFTKLRNILEALKTNNMKAILPLNYLGQGWSPQGIDPCRWIWEPTQYSAFENYAKEFLTRIEDYSDISYIMVFTEGTDGCNPVSANTAPYSDPIPYAAQLQKTLGSFPTRLPPALRAKFKIGYHDYSLIDLDWGHGSTPIQSPNSFEFLSMAVYGLEFKTDIEINSDLDARISRFKALYPDMPLIIGESGMYSCMGGFTESNQARVLGSVAKYAASHNLGVNIWSWRPTINNTDCNTGSTAGGLSILKPDGSSKEAVNTLSAIFKSNNASDILRKMDFNSDNKLNISDIGLILTQYTALSVTVTGSNQKYDLNNDNVINISDVALVLSKYTSLEILF